MRPFRPVAFTVTAVLLACAVAGCPNIQITTTDGEEDPQPDVQATPEIEPNDDVDFATPVTFDETGRARLTGTIRPIKEGGDADFYALGPMKAGDRITIDVDSPDSDVDSLIAVFDADYKLFVNNDNDGSDPSIKDPYVSEIVRHDSDNYMLVVTRSAFAGFGPPSSGAYEILATVERGGPVPTPTRQKLLLNFEGGTVAVHGEQRLRIDPFDAGDIDPRYAGQTAIVKQWIVDTARQNYARFNVEVLDTDSSPGPPEGDFSMIYFGGYDPGGLGSALTGTDPFNRDPNDVGVVFTERFTPDLFTDPPDARQLGVAIGNVAAHEAGHLLGLSHVRDATALMNGYDAPNNLLTDQRFKAASLDLRVLPLFSFVLEQDAVVLLQDTVGRAESAVASSTDVGGDPSAIVGSDFDADGKLDFAVANTVASELYILFGNGDATFSVAGPLDGGLGPSNLVAADFDADGDIDLAAAALVSDAVSVILNSIVHDSPVVEPVTVGDGPQAAAAADFDLDGDVDLTAVNVFSNDVAIALNRGDATFDAAVVIDAGPFPISIAAGDLNGDDYPDLAIIYVGTIESAGGIVVLINNGDATFTRAGTYAEEALSRRVIITDLNNDGANDIAAADVFWGTAVVLINGGVGIFAEPVSYVAGDGPEAIVGADLDADGDVDLALANAGSNDVSILLNEGDGNFAPEWPYYVGRPPSTVAAGDVDGDGDVDLAVTHTNAGTVSILLNRGNGTFARTE